jgi:hypothetical protein
MPYDEVCLATGQHDIGWLDWEMRPVLDAGTGSRGRFSGGQADTIYAQYFNFNKASVENAEALRAFLDEQHRFQAPTAASMRVDPMLADQASPETIERNQLLIAALDRKLFHPFFLTIATAKRKGGWPL